MWKVLRFVPVALRYLINVGPLLYEAVRFGIKVVRVLNPRREKQKSGAAGEKPPDKVDPG